MGASFEKPDGQGKTSTLFYDFIKEPHQIYKRGLRYGRNTFSYRINYKVVKDSPGDSISSADAKNQ